MAAKDRLRFMLLGAALLPAGVFYLCAAGPGLDARYCLGLAAAAAAVSALAAGSAIWSGLARPAENAAAFMKRFAAGGRGLEAPLAKEGWPEAENLIAAVNRVLLELNAYRAFHISQLVEERAKAQALLETITDGVLLVDDRGRLIHSNRYALELLAPGGGAAGAGKDMALPEGAGREEFRAALRALLASGEAAALESVQLRGEEDGDAPPRAFSLAARRFPLATGRDGRVIMIRDVTMEREIESARETFFHMITHDMRSPICCIRGYAEVMRKQAAWPPEHEKSLDAIIRSSRRLQGMVEDILNTMKLERGEMPLTPAEIDGAELCRRVLELHQPPAARRNIALSLIPPEERVLFRGDAALLERVAANLLGNALKFTPAGGTVALRCRADGGEVLFSVEDTGPGVPAELREKIFLKYFQLAEHKHLGAGLGLAMCKLAVELHGGRIWVESGPGEGGPGAAKGAVFTFVIPLIGAKNA